MILNLIILSICTVLYDTGGGRRSSGSRFTRDSMPDYGKTKSTLGAMEEDSDGTLCALSLLSKYTVEPV
jgi:hypothetical protein